MLKFQVFYLWVLLLHVIVSISPVSLLALANYHTLRARAAANALNWKARNRYNAAIAKSRAHLAEQRTTSKRTPRHFDTKAEKSEDIPYTYTYPIVNRNSIDDQIDFPFDDALVIKKRSVDQDYDRAPLHQLYKDERAPEPYDEEQSNEYNKQVYNQELTNLPDNIQISYLYDSSMPDNEPVYPLNNEEGYSLEPSVSYQQLKAADPHIKHFHGHGQGIPSLHRPGIKPLHGHGHLVPTQVGHNHQNIRPIHPGGLNGGRYPLDSLNSFGSNLFHEEPLHFGHHSPGNHLQIQQHHGIGHNLLRSSQFDDEDGEDEVEKTAFDRPPKDDTEMVSTIGLDLKGLHTNTHYGSNYPEPYYYSPLDFDPKKPENKQPLINYIEEEDKAIKNILDLIHTNEKRLLQYKKEQAKHLLEYELNQKKYILDYKKKQKKYLLDLALHKTSDKKYKHPLYPPVKPTKILPIPLPSNLPNYEIQNYNDKHEPAYEKPTKVVVQPYDENAHTHSNYPENDMVFPNPQNSMDAGKFDNVDAQYTDPFYSWTSRDFPKYEDPNKLLDVRNTEEVKQAPVLQEQNPNESYQTDFADFDETLGLQLNAFDDDDIENAREADQKNEDVLKKLLENHPGIEETIGLEQDNPKLEYIFHVPKNYDMHRRQSRSVNDDNLIKTSLENILKKETNLVNSLKTNADEDLLLVQNIGKNWLHDLEEKLNKIRVKRQSSTNDEMLRRLMSDPRSNIDMSKTLENAGTALRSSFEHEEAPLYHMRNMAGSAKDAVMATMKIPNQNFLIPAHYDIIDRSQNQEILGDINPRLFSKDASTVRNVEQLSSEDNVMNTFNKVGSVLKSTVRAGQEALTHAANVGNHAKNAVYNVGRFPTRVNYRNRANPRLRQATVITPRIFQISDGNRLGATPGHYRDLVTVGHLLDAVGASNPNSNLEYEKITLRPQSSFLSKPKAIANRLGQFVVGNHLARGSDKVVGETLRTLRQVKDAFGVTTMKDFFMNMRKMMQSLFNHHHIMNNTHTEYSKKKQVHPNQSKGSDSVPPMDSVMHPQEDSKKVVANNGNNETVGDQMVLAEELLHPFMNRATDTQLKDFFSNNLNYTKATNNHEKEQDNGPTVGAINKRMFERFSDKQANNPTDSTTNIDEHKDKLNEENEERVSTSMKLQGQVLKPFLGLMKNKKHMHPQPEYPASDYDYDEKDVYEPVPNAYTDSREEIGYS